MPGPATRPRQRPPPHALIRPYLAPTRDDAPADSRLVHLGVHGFPLEEEGSR